MPFSMMQFMTLVTSKDTAFKNFNRIKNSSLDPLIAAIPLKPVLTAPEKETIRLRLAYIPYDKQMKYREALEYLRVQHGLAEVAAIPYAIPCKPEMKFDRFEKQMRTWPGGPLLDPGTYIHLFRFSFSSSNGNLASLAHVGTRERVTYRTNPAGPPFNYVQANTPATFTQGATTNNGAQTGWSIDDHITILPSIICANPRVNGELVADQLYEYTSDGRTWRVIPEAYYLLKKGVRGGNTFYFAKTNSAPDNPKRSHFEVEYPIGPAPASMPPVGTNLGKGGKVAADIRAYGRVVHNT